MKIDKKGCTRLVILTKRYAIKIAKFNFKNHDHFLVGCLANWRERQKYKIWKTINYKFLNSIIPSYFCSWFGIIQIQQRYDYERTEHLTEDESKFFIENDICSDIKKENFGYYKNNLVCIDYGE